jgi:hypothetical protein
VLSTYYELPEATASGGPEWTAELYRSLEASSIGQAVEKYLIPLIVTVLGPILPSQLREFLA